MNRPLIWRLIFCAYGFLLLAVLGKEYIRAIRVRPVSYTGSGLPMVSEVSPLYSYGARELRTHGDFVVLVSGLSVAEDNGKRIWRHGLSPKTTLLILPRNYSAVLKYSFNNQIESQVMTVRLNGALVETQGPMRLGKYDGQIVIPESENDIILDLDFLYSVKAPAPDSRRITVTFWDLSLTAR